MDTHINKPRLECWMDLGDPPIHGRHSVEHQGPSCLSRALNLPRPVTPHSPLSFSARLIFVRRADWALRGN